MVLKALTDPENGAVKDLSEIGAVGHQDCSWRREFFQSDIDYG